MNDFNITEYNEITAKLNEIKEAANFIPDASTKEGYDKSKRVSLDIGKVKTKLTKTRKEVKDYWIQGGKEVDLQAKAIMDKLDEIQAPHMQAYKELDNIKKEREKERVAELESRVQHFVELPDLLSENHSSEIALAIDSLNNEECLDFYEFTAQALKARNNAKQLLQTLYTQKIKQERDAAELEELRKLKAEQDQKERDERIKREAAQKAESEAKAAIEREEQAKRDKLAAEQAQVEAEKRAIEQAKQAKIDAEQAKAKAEQDAKEAAEQARLAEIARQEQAAKAEAERLAQLEANKKHAAKIRGEIEEDLVEYGLDEETARAVTMLLCRKKIRNTQVNY